MVGLLINRSVNMMVGLLGIMKSGAAYLPIDPEYPQDRIEYISKSIAKRFHPIYTYYLFPYIL